MKPSRKDPMIASAIDRNAFNAFGRTRTASINNDICVMCGKAVGQFRDNLSLKEYTISGMCQVCQDGFFGE